MTKAWEQAIIQGDVDAVERVAAGGADVDARDAHGQTGLMLAAMRGHLPIVRLLIDRGADLNHTSKYHLSALMLAVINGHAAIARALVEAGADRSIRGTGAPGFHGRTAADLASARGEDALADLLRKEERT